jgi:zinc transport system ATP-binding protein
MIRNHGLKVQSLACGLCCTKLENFGVIRGKAEILSNVNLHIHCGELTALIGPNGAGKTTLLKAILREINHSGELIYLDAKDCRTGSPLVGYVPQKLNFDPGSPTSVLDLFIASVFKLPAWWLPSKSHRERARESLRLVQADHLLERRLGDLSGGELQRVLLALALEPIPDLLLMDEPVAGVDQRGKELFYSMVSSLRQKYDLSIILVSHDLFLISQYADRIVFLNGTVIRSGTAAEVFADERFQQTFGRVPMYDSDRQ